MRTEDKSAKSYKDTLNLPNTAFPMEARLVQNEPARLQRWQHMKLYEQLQQRRAGAAKWLLHDGPPFANGDIHIGHVVNKTLKDVFLRFKSMAGFQTPYVPGWDCHGLPIEHKIQQDLGKQFREMPPVEVRRKCYEYADKYAAIQSEQFQRLGILGNWADPYLTMRKEYEAGTLEVFARVVENGLVYKQLKTVPWSVANQTALADAELEYQDVEDTSVFVEFPLVDPNDPRIGVTDAGEVALMIWTTTPWTLPANLAVAVHEAVEYAVVRYMLAGKPRVAVVAADLVEKVFSRRLEASDRVILKTLVGKQLVGVEYRHPFVERVGKVVSAEYVTTTDGTGLVHTAPGHGEEDYETGLRHGLEVYCPVLANGRFDESVPEWLRGQTVWEGNKLVVQRLRESGALFAEELYRHSYPHDWRSKTPIIFRATEQWFVALDKPFRIGGQFGPEQSLRQRALDAVGRVGFVPEWGRARITGMLESRPDWCISRQRSWGLPIPVFYNEQGEPLLTPESVRAVAAVFHEHGSDAWYTMSPGELLAGCDPGPRFPKDKLRKERDIFDVWFESGSSWFSVLMKRADELGFPADLYLEGSDQHRGWFQLSLLPALASVGTPPFKQVLTHGFVVKPDGTKVSKSDKEYVTAMQEVNRHGADLLRLFVCSLDFQGDMPASPQAIREFGDKYRKIRNTLRYLLSNLFDYDPSQAPASVDEVPPDSLDGWALAELDTLIRDTRSAYEQYQLHRAFKLLHEFCTVQISAVYGNAMKDRLYCDEPNSPLRRRCQFVMHRMALALTKLLAPMCVFTADEAWEHLAHRGDESDLTSVHLASLPEASTREVSDEQRLRWNRLMELRDAALKELDRLKKEVGLNKALDAEVVFHVESAESARWLQQYGVDLADMVGAGFHRIVEDADPKGPSIVVQVIDRRGDYAACARSWKRRPDVGKDTDFPDLSLRDAQAVRARRG